MELDGRLDRFEEGWRAGRRPRIEELLLGTSGAERRPLLLHALRLELELRRQRGEAPAPDEHLPHFSDEAELVVQVFAEGVSEPHVAGTRPAGVSQVHGYPPLRGTLLGAEDPTHVLYTRGSVEFFGTYPGLYVPLPLELACEATEESPRILAEEVLGLTKMNWNNTQFDGKWPITLVAAKQVGSILRYLGPSDRCEPHYGFYM
jgi:hypothetical protein